MRRISTLTAGSRVVMACAWLAGCARPSMPAVASANQVAALEATDLVVDEGAEASPGAKVTVHYTGWMYDHTRPEKKGAAFDSSRKSGQPFSFVLGQQSSRLGPGRDWNESRWPAPARDSFGARLWRPRCRWRDSARRDAGVRRRIARGPAAALTPRPRHFTAGFSAYVPVSRASASTCWAMASLTC